MTTTTVNSQLGSNNVPENPRPAPAAPETLGWAAALLNESHGQSTRELVRRAGVGLALSALYGVALGARQGGRALLEHALGVPAGLIAVVLVGLPSMFVFLSLCRAPLDARALASLGARGLASAGLLLAGLAPAAALFVVSSQTPDAAASVVTVGLVLGGGVALGRAVWEVTRLAFSGDAKASLGGVAIASGFALFAAAFAARIWAALLPILGGGA
ncbi:MAG TPA: hypothetical protein VK524_21240 [Polyangiaceae bacterium]|nr:hypothetical protein [Polyangiaceae bacterium]